MSRWRWPVVVLSGVLVLGTGGYAYAQSRGSEPSYRTARASTGDVERTLDLSGTVTAAGRRDLTFGAGGVVARVAVRTGQQVRSGQVLARLDPTSFDAAVTGAVATLARAKAQLASDQDAQATAAANAAASSSSSSSSASSAAGGAANPKPRSSTPRSPTSQTPNSQTPNSQTPSSQTPSTDPALKPLLAEIAAGQQAVTEAQTAASEAIGAAKAALAHQGEACATQPSSPQPDSPSDSPSTSPADGSQASPGDGGVSAACQEALAAVQADQDTVKERQDDLQEALSALGKTLSGAAAAVDKASQTAPSQTAPSQTAPSQTAPSQTQTQPQTQTQTQNQNQTQTQTQNQTQTQTGGSGDLSAASSPESPRGADGAGGSVTAARLAQDQADIDTAGARLTEARAQRAAATLRAPYAGRILKVDLARGDLLGASDPAFVLVGTGATTVATTVTSAQVPFVRRGQPVRVRPAGWTTSLTGIVSATGLLPDSDSAYPVTVTVSSGKAVAEGTTASVSIVTGAVRDAVTVPVSALRRSGDLAFVQVLSGTATKRQQVSVGVVGTRRASITKGLERGATVVIADLEAVVPSSSGNQGALNGGPRFSEGGGPPATFQPPAGR